MSSLAAGSSLGMDAAAPGEEEPAGFNSGVGLLNPLGVARDHAGYASFFPDELREHWPSRDADARGR